jgi:hypothetical protein
MIQNDALTIIDTPLISSIQKILKLRKGIKDGRVAKVEESINELLLEWMILFTSDP